MSIITFKRFTSEGQVTSYIRVPREEVRRAALERFAASTDSIKLLIKTIYADHGIMVPSSDFESSHKMMADLSNDLEVDVAYEWVSNGKGTERWTRTEHKR